MADVDDARLAIDVAPFEREPFGQAKRGGGEQVKPRCWSLRNEPGLKQVPT
jgi:hypothetical protein